MHVLHFPGPINTRVARHTGAKYEFFSEIWTPQNSSFFFFLSKNEPKFGPFEKLKNSRKFLFLLQCALKALEMTVRYEIVFSEYCKVCITPYADWKSWWGQSIFRTFSLTLISEKFGCTLFDFIRFVSHSPNSSFS